MTDTVTHSKLSPLKSLEQMALISTKQRMELRDVDLDEKPRPPRSVSVNANPNPLAIKRGSAVLPASRKGSVKVQDSPAVNPSIDEIETTAEQLQTIEIDDKPRPPRSISINTNPNPLAVRRGSALSARSQSPKPISLTELNPESTDYSAQLKEFLQAEAAEPVTEVPDTAEYDDKARVPRTLSITSTAANPLAAKRRSSSIKPSMRLTQPDRIIEESTQEQSEQEEQEQNSLEHSASNNLGFTSPLPPPLPTSPAPWSEEDLVRPSISLSFGGLYEVRPSMIETEYVSDRLDRAEMNAMGEESTRLSAIRESESDNNYDNVYDIRASTIAVERPLSVPPPVPTLPPPDLPAPPQAPPAAPSTPPPPVPAHPLSPPPGHNSRVSMSYDSDSDDIPLHTTYNTNTTTTNTNTTQFTTVPLPYPTTHTIAVEMTSLAWKLCPSVALMWQERYLVFKTDGSIHYYTDKDTYTNNFAPRGVICISDIQRTKGGLFVELAQNKLNIGVHSKNSRVYKLKFGTAEEAHKWYEAIFRYAKKSSV